MHTAPPVQCTSAPNGDPHARVGRWGYRSYREHLAARFPGRHVRKCCLQAGFTCPNLDGTVARGGCAYCDNQAFAPGLRATAPSARLLPWPELQDQWDRGRRALRRRHRRVDGFIAYFQAYSNTHAGTDALRALYDPLPARLDECLGVSIGTRPDCLHDTVLAILEDLARRTFLTVELGLQSDRDAVLRHMNRGHDVACFHDAIRRAAGRGFELCAHVILGLPGEGADAPERLGNRLAALPVTSVKIHNLHIVRGTAWARAFTAGALQPIGRDAYLDAAARLMRRLRRDQAVQRVIADAPSHLLLGDPWCLDKQSALHGLAQRLPEAVSA